MKDIYFLHSTIQWQLKTYLMCLITENLMQFMIINILINKMSNRKKQKKVLFWVMNSIKKHLLFLKGNQSWFITQESRDSWAVQWLRLRFPMQSVDSIPGQGSKIPGCQKAKHKTGAVIANSTDILKNGLHQKKSLKTNQNCG